MEFYTDLLVCTRRTCYTETKSTRKAADRYAFSLGRLCFAHPAGKAAPHGCQPAHRALSAALRPCSGSSSILRSRACLRALTRTTTASIIPAFSSTCPTGGASAGRTPRLRLRMRLHRRRRAASCAAGIPARVTVTYHRRRPRTMQLPLFVNIFCRRHCLAVRCRNPAFFVL